VFTRRVWVNWDAAAVVVDAAAAVGLQRDDNAVAHTGHGFVDRIVNDFPDQVVQTLQTGGADVHTRSLADWVESLEHLNLCSTIIAGFVGRLLSRRLQRRR
jgi:hypothetical protein